MFCAYCGTSINDDVVFCPVCGKSTKPEVSGSGTLPQNVPIPNQTVVIAQNMYSGNTAVPKRNYPLINFSAKAFYPFLEVSMWLTLVIGAISGGIIGSKSDSHEIGAIIGVIVGVLIMLFWVINLGGIMAIFLKMKESIEEINRKTT